MTNDEKRIKPRPKYEAPTVVALGALARGAGACSAGSGDTGACTAGAIAIAGCTAGGAKV